MIDDASALWRDAEFRKSSFSGANGGDCVEIAHAETMLGVRDSKCTDGPVLMLGETQGRAFLAAVKKN